MARYTFELDGQTIVVDVEEEGKDTFRVTLGEQTFHVRYIPEGGAPSPTPAPPRQQESRPRPSPKADVGTGTAEVRAPIPGTVVSVEVQPGQEVAYGDPLLVLEAMKMKNQIRAPRAGRVAEVLVKAGDRVKYNDLLIRLEAS